MPALQDARLNFTNHDPPPDPLTTQSTVATGRAGWCPGVGRRASLRLTGLVSRGSERGGLSPCLSRGSISCGAAPLAGRHAYVPVVEQR